MSIRIIGEPPLAKQPDGRLVSRIGTLFPRSRTLITLPGIHATQRAAYISALNADREKSHLPPLGEAEEMAELQDSVDLIMEGDAILIRPDADAMDLAYQADDILQELVSKRQIKFLNLVNEKVRLAIKERGENWRIAPFPQSPEDMNRMIRDAMIPIGGRSIYYYSRLIGTRFLTYQQFCALGLLPDDELMAHLLEIRRFSGRFNRLGHPEIAFFAADRSFSRSTFPECDPMHLTNGDIRSCFERLKAAFRDSVRPDLREDKPDTLEWRNLMFAALIGQGEETFSEELMLGLSSEFYMQIEWLPGGRIEEGELIFDSIFDEFDRAPGSPELQILCDAKARGFIFNFVREFGDIEYVNVGRVIGSLSRRPLAPGRREVYIAEIKLRGAPHPVVRVLRMQKWGIREHLDEGKDLLTSIIQSEEYTEYILDRRLGCRQLGMNLPPRITTRKISELYRGPRRDLAGQTIWSTYFERDYLPGIATERVPGTRFQNVAYSLKFAELLGRAAAPNLIVGRLNLERNVLFDDGDEVLIETPDGMPREIVVSDHTGTFMDYDTPLETFSAAYARPIARRRDCFPCWRDAADAYLTAFLERFLYIQQEYRKRQRAFDRLFKHRRRDEQGSYAYRWERVLDRLNRTDPAALVAGVRAHLDDGT
jgi:hypothetical protein